MWKSAHLVLVGLVHVKFIFQRVQWLYNVRWQPLTGPLGGGLPLRKSEEMLLSCMTHLTSSLSLSLRFIFGTVDPQHDGLHQSHARPLTQREHVGPRAQQLQQPVRQPRPVRSVTGNPNHGHSAHLSGEAAQISLVFCGEKSTLTLCVHQRFSSFVHFGHISGRIV